METPEIWKPSEPRYEVSNLGRIRSLIRNKVMSVPIADGYRKVRIMRDGKPVTVSLHRLVALAFIPNPGGMPEVNHIDGDKTNNHVSNLEWATCRENIRHALRTGLRVPRRGHKSPAAKLTAADIIEIRELHAFGRVSQTEIARQKGVSHTLIHQIVKRRGRFSAPIDAGQAPPAEETPCAAKLPRKVADSNP